MTFAVFQSEMLSRLVSLLQPLNVPLSVVTFDVSQPDKLSSVSPLQPENVLSSVVTFDVSQPDKLSSVSPLHPLNV